MRLAYETDLDGIRVTYHIFPRADRARLEFDNFSLELWNSRELDRDGKVKIVCMLWDKDYDDTGAIFNNWEMWTPVGRALDISTACEALGFMSCGVSDVDESYFTDNDYTPEQLAWRDERAEYLSGLASAIEDYAATL